MIHLQSTNRYINHLCQVLIQPISCFNFCIKILDQNFDFCHIRLMEFISTKTHADLLNNFVKKFSSIFFFVFSIKILDRLMKSQENLSNVLPTVSVYFFSASSVASGFYIGTVNPFNTSTTKLE